MQFFDRDKMQISPRIHWFICFMSILLCFLPFSMNIRCKSKSKYIALMTPLIFAIPYAGKQECFRTYLISFYTNASEAEKQSYARDLSAEISVQNVDIIFSEKEIILLAAVLTPSQINKWRQGIVRCYNM